MPCEHIQRVQRGNLVIHLCWRAIEGGMEDQITPECYPGEHACYVEAKAVAPAPNEESVSKEQLAEYAKHDILKGDGGFISLECKRVLCATCTSHNLSESLGGACGMCSNGSKYQDVHEGVVWFARLARRAQMRCCHQEFACDTSEPCDISEPCDPDTSCFDPGVVDEEGEQ